MRKKLGLVFLSALLTLLLALPAMANPNLKVIVDQQTLELDVPPVVENNRTLVPLRAIFEALGATVNWDQKTNAIEASNQKHQIKLTIGAKDALVDNQAVTLDVPSKVINNRTLVPLRFIAEGLGAQVDYLADENKINITSAMGDAYEPPAKPEVTEPTTPAPGQEQPDQAGATTPEPETTTPEPDTATPDEDTSTSCSDGEPADSGQIVTVTEFRVVDSLELGKKLVVVTLSTDSPEKYNVYVDNVLLEYRSDAKKFLGDVPYKSAVEDNVVIYTKPTGR